MHNVNTTGHVHMSESLSQQIWNRCGTSSDSGEPLSRNAAFA